MKLNIKQLFTMAILSAMSSLLIAHMDYISPNEIPPYIGESYDDILNAKHLERYPKLRKIVDLDSFYVVGEIFGVDKNHAYVREEILEGADPVTFKTINTTANWSEYYAKDKDYVYKEEKLVLLAGPETFELLGSPSDSGNAYAIDKNRVFINHKVIEGADPQTFIFFTQRRARDKDHIYYEDIMLKNSDADSFKFFSNPKIGYAHDKNQVYYYSDILEEADPKTFRVISDKYGADKKSLYFKDRKIEGIEGESVEVVVSNFFVSFFKDKNHFYSIKNDKPYKFADVDPSTFILMGESGVSSYYGTDHQYVYHLKSEDYVIIEGADPKSFSIIAEDNYLKDDHHVYTVFTSYRADGKESEGFAENRIPDYRHQIIEEADAASFEYLGSGYGMDKHNIYFSFSTGYIVLEARGDEAVMYREKTDEDGYNYGYIGVGNRCYLEGQAVQCDGI